jgi:hypothetical protein
MKNDVKVMAKQIYKTWTAYANQISLHIEYISSPFTAAAGISGNH